MGNETKILSCSHAVRSSCGKRNDAHVVCQGEYIQDCIQYNNMYMYKHLERRIDNEDDND